MLPRQVRIVLNAFVTRSPSSCANSPRQAMYSLHHGVYSPRQGVYSPHLVRAHGFTLISFPQWFTSHHSIDKTSHLYLTGSHHMEVYLQARRPSQTRVNLLYQIKWQKVGFKGRVHSRTDYQMICIRVWICYIPTGVCVFIKWPNRCRHTPATLSWIKSFSQMDVTKFSEIMYCS